MENEAIQVWLDYLNNGEYTKPYFPSEGFCALGLLCNTQTETRKLTMREKIRGMFRRIRNTRICIRYADINGDGDW